MGVRSRVAVAFAAAGVSFVVAAGPALAAATPVVALARPDGRVVEVFGPGPVAYPAAGSLVSIRAVRRTGSRTVLRGVSLLDGQLTAERIVVPRTGFAGAEVVGLAFDGAPLAVEANTLVPVVDGYAIALQEASLGPQIGLVGLRVHLTHAVPGAPAGSDLLVGLPARPGRAAPAGTEPAPLLGFSPETTVAGAGGYVYPLGVRGQVIGCPFAIGSTHSPIAPPNNLASDDAVDIAVPVGTPVLAVAGGTIGSMIGPLDTTDPAMAGLRVHLDTPTQHFYYAHLSALFVHAGELVAAGQVLGLSGSANGVAHLHFAQDGGNPADTIGAPQACPFFEQYVEPWD